MDDYLKQHIFDLYKAQILKASEYSYILISNDDNLGKYYYCFALESSFEDFQEL